MNTQEKDILSIIYQQLNAAQRYRLALAILQDYEPDDADIDAPSWWKGDGNLIDKLLARHQEWQEGKVKLVEGKKVFDNLRKELE